MFDTSTLGPNPGAPHCEHPGDHPAKRFDYSLLLDGLRCRETAWLEARRAWLVREQRRLRVEELAVVAVLDERGRVDDTLAGTDGVSVREVRDTLQTARLLADRPAIAAVAAAGQLSGAQLSEVVRIADPATDAVWAEQAPAWSPHDLAQKARELRTPTVQEAAARRAARELRWWWNPRSGMLDGRFSLPDIDGALVEGVLTRMVEGLRPAKGQPWDSRAQRGADALVQLCRDHHDREATGRHEEVPPERSCGYRAHLIVQVPLRGPATVAGIPLPEQMVERLRAGARVEPVLVDEAGEPLAVGRVESVLSEKTRRVVKQRDGRCRWPGCEARAGLEVHHLWPRSWGGTDQLHNLAAVCASHHARLAPLGTRLLLGNPNHPAGLSLVERDDLPALVHHGTRPDPHTIGHARRDARAGPAP